MPVRRLARMAGIGVDRMGALADRLADPRVLRLENLDTDLRPPSGVVEVTRNAAGLDDANSYLPFVGSDDLRRAATEHVARASGVTYDWSASTVITAGGLNGVLNTLLAVLEPGDEVVLADPIYVGLVNRVRLAGGAEVCDGSIDVVCACGRAIRIVCEYENQPSNAVMGGPQQ